MKVVEEFTVSKSQAEVFDFIAVNYFDNHTKFDPDVKKMIWRTNPPMAKGTKGTEKRRFAGLPIYLAFEVTDFEAPKYIAFKNTSGPFWLDRSYTLKPADKGTKVTFVFDIAPKFYAKPMFPLQKNQFKNAVHHNIGLLREQLK